MKLTRHLCNRSAVQNRIEAQTCSHKGMGLLGGGDGAGGGDTHKDWIPKIAKRVTLGKHCFNMTVYL